MKQWIRRGLVIVILTGVMIPYTVRGVQFYRYRQAMDQLYVGEIYPERLPDGLYTGEVDVVLIKVAVVVKVLDGQIQDIQLTHQHGRGTKAEAIIRSVLEEQSLAVDTISGATDSSRVILKAIESALNE